MALDLKGLPIRQNFQNREKFNEWADTQKRYVFL